MELHVRVYFISEQRALCSEFKVEPARQKARAVINTIWPMTPYAGDHPSGNPAGVKARQNDSQEYSKCCAADLNLIVFAFMYY